jgi:hypothetical protein
MIDYTCYINSKEYETFEINLFSYSQIELSGKESDKSLYLAFLYGKLVTRRCSSAFYSFDKYLSGLVFIRSVPRTFIEESTNLRQDIHTVGPSLILTSLSKDEITKL